MNQSALNDQTRAAILEAAGRRSSSFAGNGGDTNVNNPNSALRSSDEPEQQQQQQQFFSSTRTDTNPIDVTPSLSLLTQQQQHHKLPLIRKLAGGASSLPLSQSVQQAHTTGLGRSTLMASRHVGGDVSSSLLLSNQNTSSVSETQLRNDSDLRLSLGQQFHHLGSSSYLPILCNDYLRSSLSPTTASIDLSRHQNEHRPGIAPVVGAPESKAFQNSFQMHQQQLRPSDNAAESPRCQEPYQYQQQQRPLSTSSLIAGLLTRLNGGTTTTDGNILSALLNSQRESTAQVYQPQHTLDANRSNTNNVALSTTPARSNPLFHASSVFNFGSGYASGLPFPLQQSQQANNNNSGLFALLLSSILAGRGRDSESALFSSSLAGSSLQENNAVEAAAKKTATTNSFAVEIQENHKKSVTTEESSTTSVVAQAENNGLSTALNEDDCDDNDSEDDVEQGYCSSTTDDNSFKKNPAPFSTSHASGSSSGKKSRSTTEHFPRKLHRMLSELKDESKADIISFFPHGRAFAIHKPREFNADMMTRYFRMSRLSSLQRQLNLYGFKRITEGREKGGYYHEFFIQDKPNLSKRIRRASTSNKLKMHQQQQHHQHILTQNIMSQNDEAAVVGNHHLQEMMRQVSQNDPLTATTTTTTATALSDLLKNMPTTGGGGALTTAVRHFLNQELNYNDIPPGFINVQQYAANLGNHNNNNEDGRLEMLLNVAALGGTTKSGGGVTSSIPPIGSSSSLPTTSNISPAVPDFLLRATALTEGIRATSDSDRGNGGIAAGSNNVLGTLAGLTGLSPAVLTVLLQEQALHQHQQGFHPEANNNNNNNHTLSARRRKS